MGRDNLMANRFHGSWQFYCDLNYITAAGDVVTDFTPGFAGSIKKVYFVTGTTVVSTAAKAAALNVEIGTNNLVGGVVSLSSVVGSETCNVIGKVTDGTAITGKNSFSKTDTISIEAAAVTRFSEGDGTIVVEYEGKVMQAEGTDYTRTNRPNTFFGSWCVPYGLMAAITGNVDILTAITPGFVGLIKKLSWVQARPVTTPAATAAINLEIGTTNLTGGVVALTSAACTPLGKVIAGTSITAGNRFDKDDTISIEASGVAAFTEGNGTLIIDYEGEIL